MTGTTGKRTRGSWGRFDEMRKREKKRRGNEKAPFQLEEGSDLKVYP